MLGYKFRGHTAINRRRDRRIPISLSAEANGGNIEVKDISLGGLAFMAEGSAFEIGDDILIELNVEGVGNIQIGATIVRAKMIAREESKPKRPRSKALEKALLANSVLAKKFRPKPAKLKVKREYGAAFIGLSSSAFKMIENIEMGQFRRVLRVA
jgi:hypothetical protein